VRERFYARASVGGWILGSCTSRTIKGPDRNRHYPKLAHWFTIFCQLSIKTYWMTFLMSTKWFRIHQGVAQGVEYDEENSTTTAINFHLNGSLVNVPGQANNLRFIKEGDQVDLCGRPSLLDESKTVCLAYRINKDGAIYSINELRHVIMVILGCIFGAIYVIFTGWKWPLTIIAAISIYYAISSYWSIRARGCLERAKQ
jgi:hypothetical protein